MAKLIRRYLLSNHVRFVSGADYGVLLDIHTGKFHSLNRVGAEFVRAVREGADVAVWTSAAAARYNVAEDRVHADVELFAERLKSQGLLVDSEETKSQG